MSYSDVYSDIYTADPVIDPGDTGSLIDVPPHLPRVRIEVGLSGPTIAPDVWHIGDPVRGQIGVAKIGSSDTWVEITQWVRSWTYRRGASRDGPSLRYESGTFSCELNNGDRRFDPTNLDGPYALGGVTTLQPMVRVRVTATWAGVSYASWNGFADRWLPDYSQPTWSVCTLTASDAFKVFTADRNEAAEQGAGEDSGARVHRILTSLGWPVDQRRIDVGRSNLQPTTLAGSGLSELTLTQDSELGEFYMDGAGMAVFRNRHAVISEERSNTSQAVFGDSGVLPEIPYAGVKVDNDDTRMANLVTVTNVGGTPQIAQDLVSQQKYLVKAWQPATELLLQTDAEALDYANVILAEAKDPELRFTELAFNVPEVWARDTAWPVLLGLELGTRITVIRRPPGGGTPIERDCWIRGISPTSDGANWTWTFDLQTATTQQYWTIGHPTLGRIGVNAIAF